MVRRTAIILLNISAIGAAGNLADCSYNSSIGRGKGLSMSEKTIEQILQDYTDQWMAISGVEGTAIGLFKGKPCIRIFTSSKLQQLQDKIPSTVEGYPVIIEETGTFQALD